jgi:hypothetical protein
MEVIEPFILCPPYRVIICQVCRYAVLPVQIHPHLASTKHRISIYKRRRIAAQIMKTPNLIQDREQLQREFQIPQPGQAPIPELPVYQDGFACHYQCPFVCREKSGIRKHYEQVHQWVNPYGRGGSIRQRRAHIYPWRENVHCQRFFTHGARQEYFEMAAEIPNSQDEGNVPSEATVRSSISEKGQQELERIREKQEAIASQQAVAQPEQMSDANPWLERVEWAHHLAGFTFEEMIPWAELPREDESELQRICSGFSRMIDQAQGLIMSRRCTFFARMEINRKEEGKTPIRPFQARMGDDTKERYVRIWQQIICYIYRTHHMERRPPYRLTAKQQQVFDRVVLLAQQCDRPSAVDESGIDDPNAADEPVDDDEGEDSGYDEPPAGPELQPIERECLRLCLALLDHQVHSGHYHSVVVSALAVLGIDTEQSTWLPAEGYTTKLSAVVKLARMMMVLEVYDGVPDPEHSAIVGPVGRQMERFMMMSQPTPN